MRHVYHEACTADDHRNKRLFQPEITHYFHHKPEQPLQGDSLWDCEEDSEGEDNNNNSSSSSITGRGPGPITRTKQQHREHPQLPRAHNETVFPQVPGSVQASLLSVGMRVRKAVPEGYKTLKSSNGTALPSIQTTLLSSASSKTPSTTETYVVKPAAGFVEDGLQHQRELLPFCGLHKIGGYAEQPVTNVHLYDPTGDKPLTVFPLPAEAFNQPFPTHAIVTGPVSDRTENAQLSNGNKRVWRDEPEGNKESGHSFNMANGSGFAFKIPLKVAEDDVPVSPLSETPRRNDISLPQGGSALRPFAQPRTRKHHQLGPRSYVPDFDSLIYKDGVQDVDMQVENVHTSEDFDEKESEFLRPWHIPAPEVEMGGV
ncbi:hypothetical protein BU24DRAFT_428894 [Aaosphaeria arxii CBS 175.79]|uniref:Uncharacterized protein n=1 Tax=Aaosphaeria arxii CBS 175.79 TaxID=1450172 RepID=A0A6A5X825_9PLEO|nr:uncharacterized protein BU24DRAFT_428894 [Aaosphaeria arxii CBS 175.79]KAF2008904.1 hypothetical protein BU24DRAFT_428894 [Aaosphaeria arxii CBS 175.79]